MTHPNDSAFALPSVAAAPYEAEPGLTKREYFACQAMVMWGIDTNDLNRLLAEMKPKHDMVAKFCVDFADALIIALNKEPKP